MGARVGRLHIGGFVLGSQTNARSDRVLGARCDVRRLGVLFSGFIFSGKSVCSRRTGCARRPRSEPTVAKPHLGDVSSANFVSRLCRRYGAIRVCDCCANHGSRRRRLACRNSSLVAFRVGLFNFRHRAWQLVELRSFGMEWRVGMGPSRKRLASAVDYGHCIYSLGVGARAPWHVACLEYFFACRNF